MNRTTVEEIKARIPIEELISSYVKLEKAGKSFKARCPFHNEKSASFFVSPERGGYYCFGCSAKGDIFSFVEQFEGLDFKGALKVLAEKAGVKLVNDQKSDSERDRLFQIMEVSTQFFETQLGKSKEAKEYLKRRGISEKTCKEFRIGWAPDGWTNLITYLKGNKWNEAVIEKAGLIKRAAEKVEFIKGAAEKAEGSRDTLSEPAGSAAGSPSPSLGPKRPPTSSAFSAAPIRYYDRFRGRIIFPITDTSGRVVAFTGRILVENDKSAKYLNSPDTPLFNKSQILFGLDKAKSEIRRLGYSILVEGQMDLILSHQVGVKNTIAASGTALTDQSQGETGVVNNLGMVKRLSTNMIIALDSDKAGKTAAMRAVAATALSMGMSVKIADIEGGKDPADLILSDPELWKKVLKNAKHVVEYELSNIMGEISDPHKLPKAIRERVFPFLAKIDSQMDKAYYVKLIADKTSLSEQAVWEDLRKTEKGSVMPAQVIRGDDKGRGNDNAHLNNKTVTVSSPTRLDLVERRMFGLLHLMEAGKTPKTEEYRKEIEKIAGDSYKERIERIKPLLDDVIFEAEAFFGSDHGRWDIHMRELIFNFEEDIINEELVVSMGELKSAERAGDNKKMAEMVKKCQALSIRKAEMGKRRHN